MNRDEGRIHTKRGPLRAIILAKTGEDIRNCTSCWHCEQEQVDGMDLSLGDIIHAAVKNDSKALDNQTLWTCDEIIARNPICPSGLNRVSVIHALRAEAVGRGYKKHDA